MHRLRCCRRRRLLTPAPQAAARAAARELDTRRGDDEHCAPAPSARVLLVAVPGSYRLAAYDEAARDAEVELTIASEGEHSLVGAVRNGLRVDFADLPTSLATIAAAGPFDAVLAAEDTGVELASRAARALRLPANDIAAARRARRKDLGRAALLEAGCKVPAFAVVALDQPLAPQCAAVGYPCVIKPLALSGSRGVIRCNDADALRAAGAVLREVSVGSSDPFEREHALVEAYLPGIEVALEAIAVDGELELVAIFDKPDPLEGPYFEETLYITPSRLPDAAREAVLACVRQACAAYGLRQGPVHAEVRLDMGQSAAASRSDSRPSATLLEAAARTIGGDCARLLQYTSGMTLESMVLARALGRPLQRGTGEPAAGVLMLPTPRAGVLRRVEGIRAARAVAGVEDVYIAVREGYELTPLPRGGSYLGFVFARGETPAEVEAALREAGALLNVVTSPILPVIVAS